MVRQTFHSFIILIILFFFTLITLNCTSSMVKRQEKAKSFSSETEFQLGRSIAASITGEFKKLDNKEVVTFVNKVGKSAAMFSGRADMEYFFVVLDTARTVENLRSKCHRKILALVQRRTFSTRRV